MVKQTTPPVPSPTFGVDDADTLLVMELNRSVLPARRDQLLASLIQHHAPSSVLWQVSCLPPGRVFTTTTEVIEAATARPGSVVEPW